MPDPVLIVGSIALDTVETPFGREAEALGGAATYAALAASFFAPVRVVGVVGEDFPRGHLELLASRGIDLEGVHAEPGRTFRWVGRYDDDLNVAHTLDTQLNVFEHFRPEIPERYRATPYLFLANIDPDLQLNVLDQVTKPALAASDSMNFWIDGKREQVLQVLRRSDVCLLNDAEVRMLTGKANLVTAARQVLALGPSCAVIKKGEHGAVMCAEGSYFVAPGYPLEAVKDPTGAGDTFAGGLIGYLAHAGDASDASLRKAVVYGSVLASFTVEDFSARRLTALTRDEIAERFRRFREIVSFEA
jgi:sugar/nucleoside kinase (ribokinase family)